MSQPLRIVQIVPALSLVYGGPSQMVLGLSRSLAAQGVEVTILTTNANGDAGQPPLDVPLNCPIWQDGYQIRYFRCAPFRRYKFSIGLLRWFANHAHAFDLAHIHALFSPVSSLAATIARTQHLPYILRPLGTLDPADLQKKRRLKQLYAAVLERSNLAGAAAIHFTSPGEAAVSQRFGTTTPDLIIPLGVDWGLPAHEADERSPFTLPSDRPMILFLSRLDPKKGLDLLLPALEQLLAAGLVFHFVLAGSNPQDPNYEQQIRTQLQTSALAAHTTITGFVSGQAKTALLQAADLFVLPSYYENFGIAVAEAMAAGVPVIVSDRVSISDDIQQAGAGWICNCTIDSLRETLRLALQDDKIRQQRGNQAQCYAQKHYQWQAIAQQTYCAYQDLLQQQSSL